MTKRQIRKKLRLAAKLFGVKPEWLYVMAKAESNLNPTATNKGSGAMGLFQFLKATATEEALSDPYDVAESAAVVAERTRRYAQACIRDGLEPNLLNVYLIHQQGPKGLKQIYAAVQGAPLTESRRKNIVSNLPGTPSAADDQALAVFFLRYWVDRLDTLASR